MALASHPDLDPRRFTTGTFLVHEVDSLQLPITYFSFFPVLLLRLTPLLLRSDSATTTTTARSALDGRPIYRTAWRPIRPSRWIRRRLHLVEAHRKDGFLSTFKAAP